MATYRTPSHIRLDGKESCGRAFPETTGMHARLHWKVLRLEMGNGQTPQETQREDFTQVRMRKDLEEALKRINPWMNEQQVFEAISDLTTHEGDNLYKNNQ